MKLKIDKSKSSNNKTIIKEEVGKGTQKRSKVKWKETKNNMDPEINLITK
jgi:hypothetical protein